MSQDFLKLAKDVKRSLDRIKGKRDSVIASIDSTKSDIKILNQDVEDLLEAKLILSEAMNRTQMSITGYVENLTTMVIREVFQRDYQFIMDLEIKGNRPKCTFLVQEGDWEPYIPREDQGGGIYDVIGYTLRVIFWSLQEPRSMPMLWLDEPFRFIGSSTSVERERGTQMIEYTAKELELQLIITTHETETIVPIADRVINLEYDGTKSIISGVSGRTSGDQLEVGDSNSLPRSKLTNKKTLGSKRRKRLGK